LLHELIPAAVRVGLLVNPTSPLTEPMTRDVMAAGAAIGLQIEVVEAKNSPEIEAAFVTLVRNRADALLVGPAALFLSRRVQIATLQTGHIPIIGMSAHALDSEREQAIATGCDEFDAKPIDFEHLVAAIRRALAKPK
jgi:putative tryptophan/tyrosine transport system substrate-binding protein